MTTKYPRVHRLALVEAATALAREAIGAAGASPIHSPTWYFYRGVEDAALHVLRPEMATVREGTSWLDAEDRWFRDGFLEAQLLLATAAASPQPPMRLPLPQPRTGPVS
jgi:heterodisulfide reductase subunit A-like polyferredoxin